MWWWHIVSRVLFLHLTSHFWQNPLHTYIGWMSISAEMCWDFVSVSLSPFCPCFDLSPRSISDLLANPCASALTSKPWFVRTFEYRIQCSHTADSADRCGQLVRIRPAKTKASGTRWKAAQTTTVFFLVGRYASSSANMVSRTQCVHLDVCFGSGLGEFPKVTWWPPSFGFSSSVPHVSATYYRLHRPGILVRLWGESLVVEVKFQVGKLKTSPAELACCQDLRLKASSLPWCSRNGVKQMLSMITSQVVTLDVDVTDVAETSRDSFEIFKVTACRSGLTWSSWVFFSWGNGQFQSSYFLFVWCLYVRSWVARASWIQAMAAESHTNTLPEVLPFTLS